MGTIARLVSYPEAADRVAGSDFILRETGPAEAPKPRLLDRVREAVRARHYSRRTKDAYVEIYTHVLNRGPAGVRSPADRLVDA